MKTGDFLNATLLTGSVLAGSIHASTEAPSVGPVDIDINDTGHVWVEVEDLNGDDNTCFINMDHILERFIVLDTVSGNTDGTPCDKGSVILPGQIPEDYNDHLEVIRDRWDRFMIEVAEEIVDGDDEGMTSGFEALGDDFGWVTQVGKIIIEGSDVVIVLQGNKNEEQYGPNNCSVEGIDQLRTLGPVSYGNTTYELAIELDPGAGAPCDTGDIVLLTDPKQSVETNDTIGNSENVPANTQPVTETTVDIM